MCMTNERNTCAGGFAGVLSALSGLGGGMLLIPVRRAPSIDVSI